MGLQQNAEPLGRGGEMVRQLIPLAILVVSIGAGAANADEIISPPPKPDDIIGAPNSDEIRSVPNSDVTYDIILEDKVPGVKRSIEIVLSERVDKSTLRAVAMELKSQESESYKRTFIGYYLPGMVRNNGAWATTHFNPDLEVEVLGFTREEEETLASKSKARVLGTWVTRTLAPVVVTLERSHEGLIMRRRYKDGNEGKTRLKESRKPEPGTRYHYEEGSRSGEHIRINENGNLEFWDRHGWIETAKKR